MNKLDTGLSGGDLQTGAVAILLFV